MTIGPAEAGPYEWITGPAEAGPYESMYVGSGFPYVGSGFSRTLNG